MKVCYAKEPVEKSIFLCGPTPRDHKTISWRPEALKILVANEFDGIVYVPEDRPNPGAWHKPDFEYTEQIEWEWKALNACTVAAFWVPRELRTMPAFTTNVEFGMLVASGKCIFGAPSNAPKNKYLEALARRFKVEIYEDLESLLQRAIIKCNQPF